MAFEANITTNYATNMDKAEIQRRNQVLRAYFKGRDWDENNEYNLTRHLVTVVWATPTITFKKDSQLP
jgi:hypothetical protein